MSLLNYFKKAGTNTKLSNACDSMKNDNSLPTNISADELEKVKESLKVVEGLKCNRITYSEKDKQEVAKYAIMSGAAASIRKFRQKFPHLTESTVHPWVKSYKKFLKEQKKVNSANIAPRVGKPRGRALLLEEELDTKMRSMLSSLRLAGAGINIPVVRGVLNGLIRANPIKFGKYVNFKVTRSWTRSLYQRMNFSR